MNAVDGFARQAVLLELIGRLREAGSWAGETHIQKCSYFLQEGLGIPLGLEYFLYKHGPFSFELRDLLAEMRADLLINVEPRPPYGGSLSVTESGVRLREGFPKTLQSFDAQIGFVVEHLADKGVTQLERLGTALYVQAGNSTADPSELAEQIHRIKPHISPEVAREALGEVGGLLKTAPRFPA
jgi:hypothetical protein